MVRVARDAARRHGGPDRRCRRRAVWRLRPLPGAGFDRVVPASARRPSPPSRWNDGPGLAACRPGRRPGSAELQRLFEHINEPAQDRYLGWMTTFRRSRSTDALLRRAARFAGHGRCGAVRSIRGRPGRALDRGPWPRPVRRDPVTRARWLPISRPICPATCWSRSTWPAWRTAWSAAGRFWTIGSSSWPWPCRWTERSGSGRDAPRSCSSRHSRTCLPPPIKTRSKMGFGVPISQWFRNELKQELRDRPARSRLPGSRFIPARGDRNLGRRTRRRKARARATPVGLAHARILVPKASGCESTHPSMTSDYRYPRSASRC